MPTSRQLIFDWPHRSALGRDDYLVSGCNKDAVDWIDLWPDWPAPVLIICGPPGSGKSHLAAVWRARTGALSLNPTALPDLTAIDGSAVIHRVLEKASDVTDHEMFLHLYNQISENGGSLLLTAERPVPDWKIGLPDLTSRLMATPMVEIGMPDDSLLQALLVKMFLDRQLDVDPERSFAAARSLVEKLDEAALVLHRTITVPLARVVMQENNFGTQAGKELSD
jgi:chromosomal replication initiation ATPase DnaA